MFKDPLSNSKTTFDHEMSTLVEKILSYLATWDSKENRYKNKKVYDPINAEGEINKLIEKVKKYH